MVLPMILKDCSDCIQEHAEWGLDRIWCGMASEKFGVSACSLLDATPVKHLDWRTAKVNSDFFEAERKVKTKPLGAITTTITMEFTLDSEEKWFYSGEKMKKRIKKRGRHGSGTQSTGLKCATSTACWRTSNVV